MSLCDVVIWIPCRTSAKWLSHLNFMAWVDIFRRWFSLRQQQQRPQSNSHTRLQLAGSPTEFLAAIAYQVGSLSEFPILSHLHSQPGRRCSLVQVVRLAVNSLPALRPSSFPLAHLLRPAAFLHLVAPTFLLRPSGSARLTLQTRKLWLVHVATDRPRALLLTCPNVKNLQKQTTNK